MEEKWVKINNYTDYMVSNKGNIKEIRSKKVINIETNIIYNSAKEASMLNNLIYSTFKNKLSGIRKNNTKFKYL
jgi:hypothetical protein